MAVYAVLGSSRHLVVGAASATAAILAAALAGLAVTGSARYVKLAGLAALLAGALLLLARLARLGFLANFLSRTVLVGFLTGVGIQVAAGQLPDMLGVRVPGTGTLTKLADTVRALPHAHWGDVAVSGGVIAVGLTIRAVASRVTAPLVAGAGGRSWLSALAASAVVLGTVVLLAGRLAYLPAAARAAVVVGIAAALADAAGMRRILAVRRGECAVALLTTAAVVVLGV